MRHRLDVSLNDMEDRLTYRIVRRLRAEGAPLSRNRYFPVFEAPEGRRALRIHKRVSSVESDLLALDEPSRIRMSKVDGRMVRMELHNPRLRARRTVYLSRGEFSILLESPAGDLLRKALR